MSNEKVTFDWNGEPIDFGQWHDEAVGVYDYMTRNQRHSFKFELKRIGTEVRVYIIEAPGYGARKNDGHSTHRLSDSKGHYVCIKSGLTPRNVPDALSWLVYWAEETGKYIDSGGAFS